MTETSAAINIVGAGLSGPLLAIMLQRRGLAVELHERRADMRQNPVNEGRSINLALSARGIYALEQAGIWERIREIALPMRGRMIHPPRHDLTFQPYGKDETEVIYSVSRAALNRELLIEAERRGIPIRFHERCIGFDEGLGVIRFHNELDRSRSERAGGVTIAADGANSAVRAAFMRIPRFDFSQQYLDYGYKELTVPAAPDGRHAIETNALHIWPRGAFMLIALPNLDGTFACILFLPFSGENSFDALRSDSDVMEFFKTHFPDAIDLMPHLTADFFANPVGAMVTIRCFPWHVGGKGLLLGDSAHAIVPFFGQGLNCAFEDCAILVECLERYGPDWASVFAAYQERRKPDTDAIADLAQDNFVEMRDLVADPRFLFRKKVELALEARFPNRFVPKYSMVTFHRMPYSLARSRGKVQDRLLDDLCESAGTIDELDWALAGERILRELPTLELR